MNSRPNVLFVICDDLAYADLSIHGNPHVKTPRLDAMAHESARLNRCNSGTLCTPARAAIMTGRHCQRTGAIDTYIGRAMMHHDEVTLAQMLKAAGYDTGLFGKWHLGDCYPMRPGDKGFDESLWHASGGMGQPGNIDSFEKKNPYFDPLLNHNREHQQARGYCTDIFTRAAIDWIRQRPAAQPWFAYVAFNAPHCPHDVPDEWVKPMAADLPEKWRRIYGMIANIDHNVGQLLDTLDQLGQARDTLVVFTSDHGQCSSSLHEGQPRFNAGFKGIKGTYYEGGIRVPCLVRWRGTIPPQQHDAICNPIDWVPTFAAACGFALPTDRKIDGINLLPLMRDGTAPAQRVIPMQWHRGDANRRYHNACMITQRYKWTRPDPLSPDELYDIPADPGETRNLAAEHPQIVADLIAKYDKWFDEMAAERPDTRIPPLIVVGHEASPTTCLSIQDGRLLGSQEGWGARFPVMWFIDVHKPGRYRFEIHIGRTPPGRTWHLRCGKAQTTVTFNETRHCVELYLEAGLQTATCLTYGKSEDLPPGATDPGVRTAGQLAVTRIT